MTPLGEFCAAIEQRLRPLSKPLDSMVESIRRLPEETSGRDTGIAALTDIRSRLDLILDKAAAQQAFMIVFGPLKSGKSTLMNALAGAYVSEVSSLPAYPCMVFVGDAGERRLEVTHYDGTSLAFDDLAPMKSLLDEAHRELAKTLRDAEEVGRDIQPEADLPRAIRRIDVRMPAGPLAESGAMLVDTPGLYSRMKFGYDAMAREFRDKAASAIFVVKTENLFLEQIFDEFSDLLRLFSRIFLVVNLDTSKRDLGPAGELAPSLEQMAPDRIVEAFESLAMNAELRRAWEEKRLQIYPVDLQQAASRRLNPARAAVPSLMPDGFEVFEKDLQDYLAGHEFLQAFMRDTTRQATSLMEDLADILRTGAIAEMRKAAILLEEDRSAAEVREKIADELVGHDWEKAFADVREEVRRLVGEQTGSIGPRAVSKAEGAVSRWFESDQSLADLMRLEISQVVADSRKQTVSIAAEVSRTVVGSDVSGALLRADCRQETDALDLPVAAVAREALSQVVEPAVAIDLTPWIPLGILPVKRSVWDWLFLRRNAAVRRSLFGPEDLPSRPIPAVTKQRRLSEARPVLMQAMRQRILCIAEESLGRATNEVFGRHVAAVCRALRDHLQERGRKEKKIAAAAAVQLTGLLEVLVEADALAALSQEISPLLAEVGVAYETSVVD